MSAQKLDRQRISRRSFLQGLAVAGGGALLAACQPQVIRETVEVEKVVKETVEVEVEVPVEKTVEVTAVPAPEIKDISIQVGGYTPSKYLGEQLEEGAPERVAFDEIAAEYMELHPDVEITFIARPATAAWREYIVTMCVGGEAPEILTSTAYWANEDVNKGWWLSWNPYLEMPNLYVGAGETGSAKWHDQFAPSLDFFQNPNGNIYILLGDDTQVGFWYNKDMFAQLGLKEPENWAEMIANAQAAEEELGVPGFAVAGSGTNLLAQLTWTSGWLSKFFFWEQAKEWDTDQNGWPDQFEMAEAVKAGTFTARMDSQVARLRTLKDMASHWQDGFLGCDNDCAHRLYISGQSLTENNGIWLTGQFMADTERNFELGWHYYPKVDKETSDLIPENAPMTNLAAGYGSFMYGLTETARWRGTADAVADFMMYSTTPENISRIVNEVAGTIPNIAGATAHPVYSNFPSIIDSVRYPPSSFQEDDSMLDAEYGDRFTETVGAYLADQMGEEDMLDELQRWLDEASERLLVVKAAQAGG